MGQWLPGFLLFFKLKRLYSEFPFFKNHFKIKKGKKNKVLKVIGTLLLIFFTIIIIGITAIIISWNYHNSFGEIAFTILFLSISAFFTYLSYKSVKKTIKAFSIDNNKK